MNGFFKITSIILVLIFIITSANEALAIENTTIFINEVYPKPNTDENEWIEIFNNSQEIVELSGWTLMDELSSPSIIYEFSQDTIEPLSFLIVELDSSKLNNSGDTIKLLNSNQEIVSRLEYTNSELGLSFSLTQDEGIILSTPTKGIENLIEDNSSDDADNQTEEDQIVNIDYPSLEIYEVMSCPEANSSEWIVIKNPNDTLINLDNWQIKDEANNKITLTGEEIIPKLGSVTISLTNSILNNSGDTVYLFDPNNDLVDEFEFDECKEGIPISTGISVNTATNSPPSEKTNEVVENNEQEIKVSRLEKINPLLKIVNSDKSSSQKTDNYISKQVVIRQKDLPKSAIISVIIGGAVLASSGLFFIKNPKVKSEKNY